MSANNYITISKSTFEVNNCNADTGEVNYKIGTGKNLEEAIELAEKDMEEMLTEYGIHFIN